VCPIIFSLINNYPITKNLGGIMKRFTQLIFTLVLVLVLGMSISNAQEVVFVGGPAIPIATSGGVSGANGGFAWGDLNGDGILDVFVPSNIVLYNNLTSFTPATSTVTAGIPATLPVYYSPILTVMAYLICFQLITELQAVA
jgi:hypothetical protein